MFHIRWIMAYGMSGPRASWRSADSRGGQRVLCRRHPLGECRRRSTVGHRSNVNARTRVARLLKNAGPRVQEVPTGFEGEPDPPFNVTITTRAPREGDLQVVDLNAARYWPPDIGPGPARSFRLEPGGVHEFTYPLSQLICVVNRTDTPLSKLLKQGYTVRASFEFRGTAVMSRPLSVLRPVAERTATP